MNNTFVNNSIIINNTFEYSNICNLKFIVDSVKEKNRVIDFRFGKVKNDDFIFDNKYCEYIYMNEFENLYISVLELFNSETKEKRLYITLNETESGAFIVTDEINYEYEIKNNVFNKKNTLKALYYTEFILKLIYLENEKINFNYSNLLIVK